MSDITATFEGHKAPCAPRRLMTYRQFFVNHAREYSKENGLTLREYFAWTPADSFIELWYDYVKEQVLAHNAQLTVSILKWYRDHERLDFVCLLARWAKHSVIPNGWTLSGQRVARL